MEGGRNQQAIDERGCVVPVSADVLATWIHRGYQSGNQIVHTGEPFSICLIPQETLSDFRKRVQLRTGIPPQEFATVRLVIVETDSYCRTSIRPLEDGTLFSSVDSVFVCFYGFLVS